MVQSRLLLMTRVRFVTSLPLVFVSFEADDTRRNTAIRAQKRRRVDINEPDMADDLIDHADIDHNIDHTSPLNVSTIASGIPQDAGISTYVTESAAMRAAQDYLDGVHRAIKHSE